MSFEDVGVLYHCIAITLRSLDDKIESPEAFTNPSAIGPFNFKQALSDLGIGINLMMLIVYEQFELGNPN